MNETRHVSSTDRLEAKIDAQARRLDDLYRVLESRGIFPEASVPMEAGDAFFDELLEIEAAPFARERNARRRPIRRRATRLHVGTATGV